MTIAVTPPPRNRESIHGLQINSELLRDNSACEAAVSRHKFSWISSQAVLNPADGVHKRKAEIYPWRRWNAAAERGLISRCSNAKTYTKYEYN
jgi:hypothetical protein